MQPIKLTQRDYQKKYDAKTKTLSVKYVLSDMKDHDRLMEYLDRTGQSVNGFIKMLINGFFDKGYDKRKYPIPKEAENGEYYKFDYISDECFEKLKKVICNNEDKYNAILDYYASNIKYELEYALEEKAMGFEEWVDELEESVNSGEIDISDKSFMRIVEEHMSYYVREIMCG